MPNRWKLVALGVLTILGSAPAWANSFVHNAADKNVRIFWTAAGCAGVGSYGRCGNSDGHQVLTVCHRASLKPGEGAGYKFPLGTSNRRIHAEYCGDDTGWKEDEAATGNKGDKSRCAARLVQKDDSNKTPFGVKCGYSKSQFDALRDR